MSLSVVLEYPDQKNEREGTLNETPADKKVRELPGIEHLQWPQKFNTTRYCRLLFFVSKRVIHSTLCSASLLQNSCLTIKCHVSWYQFSSPSVLFRIHVISIETLSLQTNLSPGKHMSGNLSKICYSQFYYQG